MSDNLEVLADSDDANSCRQISVGSQAQEYQIGRRDSDNNGTIIVTTPFGITDKAARVTTSKLAANTQNTATPEQLRNAQRLRGVGSSRNI
ncbi:hypothetical protein [Bradyrhizobium sp. AZCC 2262]|uniref:hypothetical protein n=1 Tax=Bradyrhizobium sp. AZCC 2262 TaxID=3117022 RepID=UPI002FF06664